MPARARTKAAGPRAFHRSSTAQRITTVKFSICIPNFNYDRYIGATIQSVLDQTHPDFEIVIADNASTDRSVEVIQSFDDSRLRFKVNNCNVGFAGNLDKAGMMASGEQMIMLSSDDLMRPDALATYQRLLEALGPRAEKALVGSLVDVIDEAGAGIGRRGANPKIWHGARRDEELSDRVGHPVLALPADELLRRCLGLLRNPFPFASLAYPRSLYEAVEGYGGGRLINPDKWFAWKVMALADMAYFVEAPLFGYRWHASNQTAQQARSGALKHLVDQYVATFDLPAPVLERAGLTRADLAAAFVEHDVALRGLLALAQHRRVLARRILHFGRAAYPEAMRRNGKVWLLRLLLLLGPLGSLLAATAEAPALRAWTRANAAGAGRSAADAWLEARLGTPG